MVVPFAVCERRVILNQPQRFSSTLRDLKHYFFVLSVLLICQPLHCLFMPRYDCPNTSSQTQSRILCIVMQYVRESELGYNANPMIKYSFFIQFIYFAVIKIQIWQFRKKACLMIAAVIVTFQGQRKPSQVYCCGKERKNKQYWLSWRKKGITQESKAVHIWKVAFIFSGALFLLNQASALCPQVVTDISN